MDRYIITQRIQEQNKSFFVNLETNEYVTPSKKPITIII